MSGQSFKQISFRVSFGAFRVPDFVTISRVLFDLLSSFQQYWEAEKLGSDFGRFEYVS